MMCESLLPLVFLPRRTENWGKFWAGRDIHICFCFLCCRRSVWGDCCPEKESSVEVVMVSNGRLRIVGLSVCVPVQQ